MSTAGSSEGKGSKGSSINGDSKGAVPLAIMLDPAPTDATTGASKAAAALDGPLKRFTPFDYGCTSKPRSTLWKPTNRSDQGSANGSSQRGASPDPERAERIWPDSPGSASSCLPIGLPGLGTESEDGFDNLFPLTARPVDFHDPYLFPTLSKDERDRLTAFHRVSQGLEEDPVLMQHLAELVTIIKDIFAYEIVIIGIFDSDAYVQIVADGYPKLIVPRRESTCAHTILQPPGTVLNITDMANDWRFAESPPVAIGGLRTYAGTPLIHHAAQTGDPVAVGSVCIASFKTKPPLTDAQKSILVRFGKTIMHAINSVAARTEESRQRQFRDIMTDLTSLGTDPTTVVERALAALRLTHPQCRAKLVTAKEGSLELQGEGAVALTEFEDSLWENVPLIDYWFTWKNNKNSREGESQRTTRALACLVSGEQYLVLESSAIPNVFQGGVDVLFLRSVAMVVAGGFQARQLQEALEAKESFLRDVQHSLRTSLNGVLSASEMLLDDISQSPTTPRLSPSLSPAASVVPAAPPRAVLANGPAPFPSTHLHPIINSPAGPSATPATHEDLLTIIDASGRELLTVINSLLGFQTTPLLIKPNSELCNLTELEEEVCEPALQACSRYQLSRVTLVVRNELPDHLDTLATDLTLFRQIVSILLQNAIDATDLGTVVLSVRLATDGNAISPTALVVEVEDTGAGIAKEHLDRIFEPFYKVNPYSSHAGLGLSFAKRYAEALGGSINIIATEMGKGSTVRFTLPNPILTRSDECALDQHHELLAGRKYYMCPRPPPWEAVDRDIALALGRFGCESVQAAQDADLIVQDAGAGSASEKDALAALQEHQCLLRLVSVAAARNKALVFSSSGAAAERIVYCHLPLYKKRLRTSIMALERALQRVRPDSKVATKENAKEAEIGSEKRGRQQLRVLVVDDNEFNLKILSSFCRKKLYDHFGARDGREAYETYVREHAAGRPFTFCAMDLQMPECDGLESTRLIRQYEKEHGLRPCHIYMITGQSGEDDRKASMAVGCDGFHVKPVRMKQLDDLVSLHFHNE